MSDAPRTPWTPAALYSRPGLTRDQTYTLSKLLPIQAEIEEINAMYCSKTRPVDRLRYLYPEAARLTANLAFSFALEDLDTYQLLLSAALAYQTAEKLLVAA